MEMNTRCGVPARRAASTSVRVISTSAAPRVVAQCTIASAPATAPSTPAPLLRSATTLAAPGRLLATRTSCPPLRSRATTARPRVPVPPVTRTGPIALPGVVKDDAQHVPVTGVHGADAVAQLHAVVAARSEPGAVPDREDHRLAEPGAGGPPPGRLPPPPLPQHAL